MTKKAMISMPMNNRAKCDIEANFNHIKTELEAKGFEVIDSVIKDFDKIEAKNKAVYCLAKSIAFLSEADLLYCAKGWQNARGCKIEHEIAVAYGLEVIYEYVL